MTFATDITRDAFLGGAVTIIQPASGYRAGLDAVLLAASVSATPGERLAEAGCGAGTALICAAHRLGAVHVHGFERDSAAARLAEEGVVLNGLQAHAAVTVADIAVRPPELENTFDQAFANPPYFEPGTIRAPAAGREGAYLAETPLKTWVLFLHHVTSSRGKLTLIHRAGALGDLLELLGPRTGEIEVLPVRPAPGAAASRVLVRGRKGLRRGPVTLYDGLTLHEASGGPLTPRAAAVLAGGELEWR